MLTATNSTQRQMQQATRDAVFAILGKHEFRIDATILEKSNAQPQTRTSEATFYRYAWFYHFKHVGPWCLSPTPSS
jgi:hypothetical protein